MRLKVENEKEFIDLCQACVACGKTLPLFKHSYDFLYQDTMIKKHIYDYFYGCRWIKHEYAKSFNKTDCITIEMIIRVYAQASFFDIVYNYSVELKSRRPCLNVVDDYDVGGRGTKDIFNLFESERNHIVALLYAEGYKEVDSDHIYTRIPLIDKNNTPQGILGRQRYLQDLLSNGIEYYNQKQGHLAWHMNQDVSALADDIIRLANAATLAEDVLIMGDSIDRVNHDGVISLLEQYCKKYGGNRLPDRESALVWFIGSEIRYEGDLRIQVDIHVYVSKYIPACFIQGKERINVKDEELGSFIIETNEVGFSTPVLLELAANCGYCLINNLDSLGYTCLETLDYKVLVRNGRDTLRKEIEIGELLFGLQKDEYRILDTIYKEG